MMQTGTGKIASEVPDARKKGILFVNTYRGSGIGDFGLSMRPHFSEITGAALEYIETYPSWRNFLKVWYRILTTGSRPLFNLGFTSYGKSSMRNFLNFLFIGAVSSLMNRDVRVILHDSPELFESNTSGYRFLKLKKVGGGLATRFLKEARISVFSVQLHRILKDKYGFENVELYPFPCTGDATVRPNPDGKPLVLSVGYIAPYKGLEILPEIKKLMPDLEFIVAGKFHSLLQKTRGGREYKEQLEKKLLDAGIKMPGYVSDEDLNSIISAHRVVGILPYKSTSGSSYAAAFFIERGIPFVTSDLEEFRHFEHLGGGIKTTKESLKDICYKIENTLFVINNYNMLHTLNMDYCAKYSFSRIIESFSLQ